MCTHSNFVEDEVGAGAHSSVATHVANATLSMVLIVDYSLLAVRPQGHPDGGSVDRFASLFSTWPIPVPTLVAAIWAARGTRPGMTVWRGLAVGVLVASIFGLLFWPNGLQSLALFVPTVVAGFVGGVIRKTLGAGRSKPEQSRSEA